MEEANNTHRKPYDWLTPYHFKKGNPGSPGRPKGKTLKEFAREFLQSLPDDEKIKYLRTLDEDLIWKMAEGNPDNSTKLGGDKEHPLVVEISQQSVKKYNVPTSESGPSS